MRRKLVFALIALSLLGAVNLRAAGETSRVQQQPPPRQVDLKKIEVPNDFVIVHSSGPAHADRGTVTKIYVNAGGEVTVTERAGFRAQKMRGLPAVQERSGKVSHAAVKRIYAQVAAGDFFSVQDPPQRHRNGWSSVLIVTAQGKSHSVRTGNPQIAKLYETFTRETKAFQKK
jgi:hypothetical protein